MNRFVGGETDVVFSAAGVQPGYPPKRIGNATQSAALIGALESVATTDEARAVLESIGNYP